MQRLNKPNLIFNQVFLVKYCEYIIRCHKFYLWDCLISKINNSVTLDFISFYFIIFQINFNKLRIYSTNENPP